MGLEIYSFLLTTYVPTLILLGQEPSPNQADQASIRFVMISVALSYGNKAGHPVIAACKCIPIWEVPFFQPA